MRLVGHTDDWTKTLVHEMGHFFLFDSMGNPDADHVGLLFWRMTENVRTDTLYFRPHDMALSMNQIREHSRGPNSLVRQLTEALESVAEELELELESVEIEHEQSTDKD